MKAALGLFLVPIALIVSLFLPLRSGGRNMCEEGALWTFCLLLVPFLVIISIIGLVLIIVVKLRKRQ
jgi:hypothetical protein